MRISTVLPFGHDNTDILSKSKEKSVLIRENPCPMALLIFFEEQI